MEIKIKDIQKIMSLYKRLDKALEIKVDGTSMFPLLKPGEIIFIKKKDKYRIGDILVFQYYDNNLTIHRLLKKHKGAYICKGDNSYNLERITSSDIIGKMMPRNNEKCNTIKKYIICKLSYMIGEYAKKAEFNIPIIQKYFYYKIFRILLK